jgi:hypothetical protein
MTIWLVTANGCTAIFKTVHSCVVPLQTIMQAVAFALQLFTAAYKFTICSVHLSPHTALSLAEQQELHSQLPAPFVLLGAFNAQHNLWNSVDEDERERVMGTLISRGNRVVLNTGEPTHISLSSGNLP